ncbi:hypothetical protein BT63DRAFT_271856 [Microthyrium microscopicum]|uniref:BZIP domain-containing protein n=1 Tax=Microthyrium microscopicum TaxID=703497 RepID=A0A6A6UBE8_9PEZI|nr:hypothetical protein BT63DRAFT_271856 [Microthyrium microscopicum]
MISIQVPHFMSHQQPFYNPMSHPAFLNGMSAIPKPASASSDSKANKPCSPGAKRRPSRAGTRSVATLTAAQLERKRANDREAQRAIRQRTKDHIDSLERRISELTSTSDISARLAQALQRNEELEQENKILRSRLNQAVTAMAEGNPISPEMLTGPTSPTRRLRITTRSSSVPTVPRSIPNSAIQTSHAMQQQQDHWNQSAFHSPTSGVDRSPSLADVSPVSTSIRWAPHPHPSPALSDQGGVDPNTGCPQPSPVNFNYMLDNGRSISYSPASDPSMMQQFSQAGGHDHSHAFASHSQSQMSAPIPSPAYTQYPATPQSFIATSPHEADASLQHLMSQQSPVEAQPIMYSMPTNSIKEE